MLISRRLLLSFAFLVGVYALAAESLATTPAARVEPGDKRYLALKQSLSHLPIHQQHVQLLSYLQSEKDRNFRFAALQDMADWPEPEAVAYLKRVAHDPADTTGLKYVAGASLAHQHLDDGKAEAVAAIVQRRPGRDAAMETLAELNAVDQIPALEHNPAATANPEVADDCALAVLRIRMHPKSTAGQETMLKDALLHSPYDGVRRWCALRLTAIGDPHALQILGNAAKSERDPSKKEMLLSALQMGVEQGHWTAQAVSQALRK